MKRYSAVVDLISRFDLEFHTVNILDMLKSVLTPISVAGLRFAYRCLSRICQFLQCWKPISVAGFISNIHC